MDAGHAPKCPSPRDSWLFLPCVSWAGPNCLTPSCPFHFMKQATNSTQLSKFPDDLRFALFYYPLRNVSVIEIWSRRVLRSCHLAFYFRVVYLHCAFKPHGGPSLPKGPPGPKPRISSLIQRQEVKQRSWCSHLLGSQKEEGCWHISVGSCNKQRREIYAEIYAAGYISFIDGDMAICFFSHYSNLSVGSSWFSSALWTPTANSPLFHLFLLPELLKPQRCQFLYHPSVSHCKSNSFWCIAQALPSPPLCRQFADCIPRIDISVVWFIPAGSLMPTRSSLPFW